MRPRWRQMFISNVETAARWDRWDLVALVLAVFTALWVFALKLKTFCSRLPSDLFVMVQAAKLSRKGIQDNRFGNLQHHTHFLASSVLDLWQNRSVPACYSCFASVGAVYFCATYPRLLGVNGHVALIAARLCLCHRFRLRSIRVGFGSVRFSSDIMLVLFYFHAAGGWSRQSTTLAVISGRKTRQLRPRLWWRSCKC
jgi:hypothetical protein